MIKKFLLSIWLSPFMEKVKRFAHTMKVIVYKRCYGKDIKCTADSVRCESNMYSKNYGYDVLGEDIPVCCASHLVELLFWVDKILRKHEIQYFMNYGTFLGTVRHHGGIIPWDTDVDVNISQADLDKVFAVLKEELGKTEAPYFIDKVNDRVYGEMVKVYYSKVNTLHVDLFTYSIVNDRVDFHDFNSAVSSVFPLKEREFYGRMIFSPQSTQVLNDFYGDEWDVYYYKQWGLNTTKKVLTDDKRVRADIDLNLMHSY